MTSKQIREGDFPDKPAKGAKVLVIGSLGHAGVTCVDWVGKSHPNLADFDVVIVNGPSLVPHLIQRDQSEFSGGRREESWEGLRSMTSRVAERLGALLASGGTVYAIVPDVAFVKRREPPDIREVDTRPWLPLSVHFNKEEGDTVEVVDDAFARYLAHVRRWRYSFKVPPSGAHIEVASATDQEAEHATVTRYRSLAVNRQGQPIGLEITASVHRRTDSYLARAVGDRYERDPYQASGPLVLLPPPTEVSDEEAVRILLEDCCGIQARATAPAWAVSLELAANRELQDEIRARRADIDSIHKQLEPLLKEKERREAFKAILYETGISPLQGTVEAAFKELGFKTLPSDVSDEFYIEFKGTRALAEVKGHDKSASLTDLRQLIDYQLAHEQKHGTAVKSVLVVNAWRKVPPEKRGLAATLIFPPNVVGRAEANNIALLDTVQLFDALNALWLQKTGTQQLFDRLLNTQGVVTLVD